MAKPINLAALTRRLPTVSVQVIPYPPPLYPWPFPVSLGSFLSSSFAAREISCGSGRSRGGRGRGSIAWGIICPNQTGNGESRADRGYLLLSTSFTSSFLSFAFGSIQSFAWMIIWIFSMDLVESRMMTTGYWISVLYHIIVFRSDDMGKTRVCDLLFHGSTDEWNARADRYISCSLTDYTIPYLLLPDRISPSIDRLELGCSSWGSHSR